MTDIIDRVARALCEASLSNWDASSREETANGESPEEQREYWRDMARVAIATMREPTGGMFTAGQKAVASMEPKSVRTVDWEQVYSAMIDAALTTGGRDADAS